MSRISHGDPIPLGGTTADAAPYETVRRTAPSSAGILTAPPFQLMGLSAASLTYPLHDLEYPTIVVLNRFGLINVD